MRRHLLTLVAGALLAGAVGAFVACTPKAPGTDVAPPEGGAGQPQAATASACSHQLPPKRPSVVDAGGSIDLVFAVEQTCLGTQSKDDAGNPLFKSYGFDLDDTCTGEGQGFSCAEPPIAMGTDHTDGVAGTDNAYTQSGIGSGLIQPTYPECTPAAEGQVEEIYRISHYSGGPNDDQVEVSQYFAFGLSPHGDGGSPSLDGGDRWTVLPETLGLDDAGTLSLDAPRFRDEKAYVTDGVLVAQFDAAQYPIPTLSAPTLLGPVSQVVITGRLERAGDAGDAPWQLVDVRAGSRLPVGSILAFWGRNGSAPTFLGAPVCSTPDGYQKLKDSICRFVDIASRANEGPSAPCDALSSGVTLTMMPAVLGDIGDPAQAPAPCAPRIVPETDNCNY